MRTIHVGLVAASIACSARPPGPPEERATRAVAVATARIVAAHQEFDKLLLEQPDAPVAVLASLDHAVAVDDLVSATQAHGVQITAFRHGGPKHSGGYQLRPGETLESAIAQYRRDAQFFTETLVRQDEQQAAATADPALRQALQARAQEGRERLDELTREGLLVTGAELAGTPAALDRLRRSSGLVRAVEIQRGTRHVAAVPTHVR